MAYQVRLTPIGQSKLNAFLSGGAPIQITEMALGDQNGTETTFSDGVTNIIHEVYRDTISGVYADPSNALRKICELVVPIDEGGFWIREAAIIDVEGDIIAVANLPPRFKPIPASGSASIQQVKLGIILSNANALAEFVVDGSSVYATRNYAQSLIDALPEIWADSAKLGGQLPAHYATQSALSSLSSTVTGVSGSLTTLEQTVNAIAGVPTGTEFGFWGVNAPAGYVLASGRTIGSALSGATERAADDTQALFSLLWSAGTDTTLPIQTNAGSASTRGASAAVDFAANKRITLPDLRGRVGVGKDDMGGTAASRMSTTLTGTRASTSTGVITGLSSTAGLSIGMSAIGTGIGAGAVINSIDSATQVTLSVNSASTGSGSIRFAVVDGATIGASGGAHTHTLVTQQMPAHTHSTNSNSNRNTVSGGSDNVAMGGASTINSNSTGGGQAHPNVQPSIVRNVIIKL